MLSLVYCIVVSTYEVCVYKRAINSAAHWYRPLVPPPYLDQADNHCWPRSQRIFFSGGERLEELVAARS